MSSIELNDGSSEIDSTEKVPCPLVVARCNGSMSQQQYRAAVCPLHPGRLLVQQQGENSKDCPMHSLLQNLGAESAFAATHCF